MYVIIYRQKIKRRMRGRRKCVWYRDDADSRERESRERSGGLALYEVANTSRPEPTGGNASVLIILTLMDSIGGDALLIHEVSPNATSENLSRRVNQ